MSLGIDNDNDNMQGDLLAKAGSMQKQTGIGWREVEGLRRTRGKARDKKQGKTDEGCLGPTYYYKDTAEDRIISDT